MEASFRAPGNAATIQQTEEGSCFAYFNPIECVASKQMVSPSLNFLLQRQPSYLPGLDTIRSQKGKEQQDNAHKAESQNVFHETPLSIH